jgi:transposase
LDTSIKDVASIFNVSPRTIQRWVSRFNARGIDGLIECSRCGRPRKVGPGQAAIYRELIEYPEKAEQTHWTVRKFHGYLRDELKQEVGYFTLVRWLHDNNFRLKVPQPWPDREDEQKRQAFIEKIKGFLADSEVELWYADESGIEGDPRPRRRLQSREVWINKPKAA